MREIAPGIFHWTAPHPRIKMDVSSYFVAPARTLLDPMEPAEGLDWFREGREPERIVLTNRHHYRHSDRFREAFGCAVLCGEPGLHEFEGGPEVEGFEFGARLAPGISAHEVGAICPDESAVHVEAGGGALAVADGVIHYGELRFVSDSLLGDDPEGVKRGLRRAYARLCALEFDSILCAHGEPLVGGGREALRRFAEADG